MSSESLDQSGTRCLGDCGRNERCNLAVEDARYEDALRVFFAEANRYSSIAATDRDTGRPVSRVSY
jgi:hypothetical protein